MTLPSGLPWDQVPDSGKRAVADLIVLLAQGFTGRIELACNQGGVRRFDDGRSRAGEEIGSLARALTGDG